MLLKYFSVRGGWVGGATAYLGGPTAYLIGGKMNQRIRLTSDKVGVEVEAELGNTAISSSNLKLKESMVINSLTKGAIFNPTPIGEKVN